MKPQFISVLLATLVLHTNSISQLKGVAGSVKHPFHWNTDNWQDIAWQESIRNSKTLEQKERAALIDAVANRLRPDKFDPQFGIGSEKELRKISADTRIRLIDLNGDGVPEVFAQAIGMNAGCSPTGNCPFWVFQKTERGYRTLLDETAQTFTVQDERSLGFKDLVLGLHGSASEQTLLVYRYKGTMYRKAACYDSNWQTSDGITIHRFKKARITPCRR